ncbi:unnamed protein product [Cyclocybe aegerita]|uniref:Uncharacterized protein n=1 Tax=Cyclocybe aegerita TaxID=1973307 RepID=A0A8S0W8V9_CYCAE|nr:unnamed protein product [Cyclocybe aegerita]
MQVLIRAKQKAKCFRDDTDDHKRVSSASLLKISFSFMSFMRTLFATVVSLRSLIGAPETHDIVAVLDSEATGISFSAFKTPVAPYAGGHYYHLLTLSMASHTLFAELQYWFNGLNWSAIPHNQRTGWLYGMSR